jgi:hypothetical protein
MHIGWPGAPLSEHDEGLEELASMLGGGRQVAAYRAELSWQASPQCCDRWYDADDFERMGARLQPVESPELEHLTPQDLTRSARGLPQRARKLTHSQRDARAGGHEGWQ